VSAIQLETTSRHAVQLISDAEVLVTKARRLFDGVSVGCLDATRAEPGLLLGFAQAMSSLGARRVRIADTVGVGDPFSVHRLFAQLTGAVPSLDFEFHGHNDLGMATANALAAVEGGARSVSVTVNGLGERAGNAPLEEVVAALMFARGVDTGVDLGRLTAICHRVAELSGRPVPVAKPIVGERVYVHESGIHVAGLIKDPRSFQPFLPEEVGAVGPTFVAGKHSGSKALRHLLSERGIVVQNGVVDELLPLVRRAAEQRKRELLIEELEELHRRVLAKHR
jgi:homocitrate synthase NifV